MIISKKKYNKLLKRIDKLETALQVIHTWAICNEEYPGTLYDKDVVNLCNRAIDRINQIENAHKHAGDSNLIYKWSE